MEKINTNGCKVCVTGGAGYIGTWLVKKLLNKGHTVHAALKEFGYSKPFEELSWLGDKISAVQSRMFKPDEFEDAIRGCGWLSGTVKRLIYTASVFASSPLKDDWTGSKDFVDETSWSPPHLLIPYGTEFVKAYQDSKTQAEKEILTFEKENGGELEVATLTCGLVGGDTLVSNIPSSVAATISQLTNNTAQYNTLKYLEEVIGKVPLIHIDDVCGAHVYCMENPSVQGRILCASSFVPSAEIASYFQQHYPQVHMKKECLDGPKRQIECASSKLTDEGFAYKNNMKTILDDSVSCATRMDPLEI